MHLRRYISFSLLIFILSTLCGQNKVRVLDKEKQTPLIGVNVKADRVTVTDENGYFFFERISPVSNLDTLTLSHIGYLTQKICVQDITDSVICLTPRSYQIDPLVVRADKKLNESIIFDELAPLKRGVYGFGVSLVGGSIYVIGGDSSKKLLKTTKDLYSHNSGRMQIYNIESDSWTLSDLKFSNRAYHNMHYNEGRIYIIGGKRLSKNSKRAHLNDLVEVYDINRDTIYSSNSNPHQAVNFASGLYNGSIFVMNGSYKEYKNGKLYTPKAHLFDLQTGYWYELEDVPYAYEAPGIVIDTLLFHVGGYNNQELPLLNTYNLHTGEYQEESTLPVNMERPALAYNEQNHTLYIFEDTHFLTYNVLSKVMYSYKIDLELKYSQMIYKDGFLYIIGGRDDKSDTYVSNITGSASFAVEELSVEEEVSAPSQGLYRINLETLNDTEYNQVRVF